jgi:hypothetical protein
VGSWASEFTPVLNHLDRVFKLQRALDPNSASPTSPAYPLSSHLFSSISFHGRFAVRISCHTANLLLSYRLESHLLQLLQESGWSENLRNLCQERLRDPTANIGNYEELRNSVDTQAKEMVPEAVKAEMVKKIAVLLRGMCEE